MHCCLLKVVLLIVFFLCPACIFAQEQLAFPGAEGYGKYTIGGRGGDVYEVTNLNESGEGSLRVAVEASGPRTVVFRVSGTIDLKKALRIKKPFITIAGQSAPGGGICIKGYPLLIDADEVIIRHIRVRLGDGSGEATDAISARYIKNLIIDHVSAGWSVDEAVSIYHSENVTVQWCLIAESMYKSNHGKGHHGFGGIWGSNYSSYHHNLLAHHSSRNPRFASGCGNTDYRNNVLYNWGYDSCYGGRSSRTGIRDSISPISTWSPITTSPDRQHDRARCRTTLQIPSTRNGANDYGKWFMAANVMEGNSAVTADNWNGGVQPAGGITDIDVVKLDQPWPAMAIDQQTAEDAFHLVLEISAPPSPTRRNRCTRCGRSPLWHGSFRGADLQIGK